MASPAADTGSSVVTELEEQSINSGVEIREMGIDASGITIDNNEEITTPENDDDNELIRTPRRPPTLSPSTGASSLSFSGLDVDYTPHSSGRHSWEGVGWNEGHLEGSPPPLRREIGGDFFSEEDLFHMLKTHKDDGGGFLVLNGFGSGIQYDDPVKFSR